MLQMPAAFDPRMVCRLSQQRKGGGGIYTHLFLNALALIAHYSHTKPYPLSWVVAGGYASLEL